MNILERLQNMGIEPKFKKGTGREEWVSRCPKTGCCENDGFIVWPNKDEGRGGWYCRGCVKGGDFVQFLVDYCAMDYKDAFAEVGREMPADYTPQRRDWRPKPMAKPVFQPKVSGHPEGVCVSAWRQHVAKFVDGSHRQLLDRKDLLAYLAGRGVDEATIRKFMIGYNPGENGNNAIYRPRESWGLPTVMKGEKKKKLWIPKGIVIPWFDENKKPCRVRIRRDIEDLTPDFDTRYYVLPGSAMMPMMINPGAKAFVVVETELDGFMIDRFAGDLVGVLALGACSLKPDMATFTALKESLYILNALDFDEAGLKARKWWEAHFDSIDQVERWPVPSGKDPGDAYQDGVDIRQWILAGLPPAFHVVPSSTVGPLPLDCNEERGRPDSYADGGERGNKEERQPEAVKLLGDYLKKYPFKIECSATRTRIHWHENFHNDDVKQIVSKLVFLDPDVDVWLHEHPEDMIHRENI